MFYDGKIETFSSRKNTESSADWGFPSVASGKEPACQWRNMMRPGFNLCVEKIPLKEGMATHSSILAWRTPWTEDSVGQHFMGSQRVGHEWSNSADPLSGLPQIFVHSCFSKCLVSCQIAVVPKPSCFLLIIFLPLGPFTATSQSSRQLSNIPLVQAKPSKEWHHKVKTQTDVTRHLMLDLPQPWAKKWSCRGGSTRSQDPHYFQKSHQDINARGSSSESWVKALGKSYGPESLTAADTWHQ